LLLAIEVPEGNDLAQNAANLIIDRRYRKWAWDEWKQVVGIHEVAGREIDIASGHCGV
jgi:hypothetical protein